jgi:hypothetical protein
MPELGCDKGAKVQTQQWRQAQSRPQQRCNCYDIEWIAQQGGVLQEQLVAVGNPQLGGSGALTRVRAHQGGGGSLTGFHHGHQSHSKL